MRAAPATRPAFLLADHNSQSKAFEALLDPDCIDRILLLHGPLTRSGKTRLLDHCCTQLPPHVYARLDIRDAPREPIAELFSLLQVRLSERRLPRLTAARRISAGPLVEVAGNRLIGLHNSITVSMNGAIDPERDRAAFAEAFFADASELTSPVLIVIDTFEKASPDVQAWIRGPFLTRVDLTPQVRVVIAGQSVPERSSSWSASCGPVHNLAPVVEPKDWMEVIESTGRYLDSSDPQRLLEEICFFADGNPQRILSWIETRLPLRATAQ